ncbi:hypothetical protein [Algicola sagamiensis]|uniref:hypothetical protein n=1 Tax=Algicola sagamiensis TaxID=163869 RepID=UPI00035C8341|nr:hypothetical protein [Algicola sagamiensis]
MNTCTCFEDILKTRTEMIQQELPEGATHVEIYWNDSAYIFSDTETAPSNPAITCSYRKTKKDGTPYSKKNHFTTHMLASHCCFCGRKFQKKEGVSA